MTEDNQTIEYRTLFRMILILHIKLVLKFS